MVLVLVQVLLLLSVQVVQQVSVTFGLSLSALIFACRPGTKQNKIRTWARNSHDVTVHFKYRI